MRALSPLWRVLVIGSGLGCSDARAPVEAMAYNREPSWAAVQPLTPASFFEAKEDARALHADHRLTFYCACRYDEQEVVDPDGCGYEPRVETSKPIRVEWEHVVPVHAFGGQRPCWSGKGCQDAQGAGLRGRACCEQPGVDDEFAAMESDLQNLVPAVSELNRDRRDYVFGAVAGEYRAYGACDFEVDSKLGVAEPSYTLYGDIARTYLYMFHVYGAEALPLSTAELRRFWQWHEEDPPSAWERKRNARIEILQGAANPLALP